MTAFGVHGDLFRGLACLRCLLRLVIECRLLLPQLGDDDLVVRLALSMESVTDDGVLIRERLEEKLN